MRARLVLASLMVSSPVFAATFTVNSPDDVNDGSCNATHCSLREAIVAANAAGGADTIAFDLPAGSRTIRPTSAYQNVFTTVVIDGLTQPGATASDLAVSLDGNLCSPCTGLFLNGSGATARGLIMANWDDAVGIAGANVVVQSNWFGVDSAGNAAPNGNSVVTQNGANAARIGGAGPGEGNVFAATTTRAVALFGGSGIEVKGNRFGVMPDGTAGPGILQAIFVDADDSIIGGAESGAGNVIAGAGTAILTAGDRVTIAGNRIGFLPDGSIAGGTNGLDISNGVDITVGGTNAGAGNVIGGLSADGVLIAASNVTVLRNVIGLDPSGTVAAPVRRAIQVASGSGIVIGSSGNGNVLVNATENGIRTARAVTIQGNWIGVTPAGAAMGNTLEGVYFDSSTIGLVGGTGAGEGNEIAFNASGVRISGTSARVQIRGNAMHDHADRSIVLGTGAVNANDALDADTGPNLRQNHPVVETLSSDGSFIAGVLSSEPSHMYAIDLFSSPDCSPASQPLDGATYLGSVTVATNAAGQAPFTFDASADPLLVGECVAATATRLDTTDRFTSEMSPTVRVQASDLAVTLLADDPVLVGEELVWHALVVNSGLGAAAASTMVFPYPAGTTFVEVATDVGSCADGGAQLECAFGMLASGSSANVTVTVGTSTGGMKLGTATADASGTDGDPGNDAGAYSARVDTAPVATTDSVSVEEDGTLVVRVSVLSNDTDAENDDLELVSFGQPASGALLGTSLEAGTFTYEPAGNFNGTDSIPYVVSDGFATSEGVVSITITPVNDPPSAPAPVSPAEGDEASTPVTFSWSDAADIDGDALSYRVDVTVGGDVLSFDAGTATEVLVEDDALHGEVTWSVVAIDPSGAESASVSRALTIASEGGGGGGGCGCSTTAARPSAGALLLGALAATFAARRRRVL